MTESTPAVPPLAPPPRAERIAAWVGAVFLAGTYLAGVAFLQGSDAALQAATFLGLSAAGAGKLVIFAALHPGCDLSAWALATGASVAEIGLSAVLVTHLDLLRRVPRLGPRLDAVRARGAAFLARHRGVRKLAGIGVGLYTALPFSGTGPLGSSFFGLMAGLTRRATWLGIASGSLASSAVMAWGAEALRDRLETLLRHPALTVAGVALTLGLLSWIGREMFRGIPNGE